MQANAVDYTQKSDLGPLVSAAAPNRLVLLGDSTHGTSEYYVLRDQISRKLIRDNGFSFVGVEGDWNAIYQLNAYVKGFDTAGRSAAEIICQMNMTRFALLPAVLRVLVKMNGPIPEVLSGPIIHMLEMPGLHRCFYPAA